MGARKLLLVWLLAASLSALMWACRGPTVVPDHLTPLPSGAGALRKVIDIAAMPDFETAYNQRDRGLVDAVDRSLTWFATSAARQRYPSHGIPFDVAHAGVFAFRQLLAADVSPQSFRQTLLSEFDVYSSVGSDQRGGVLFTGYYSPVFPASTRRTEEYRYPLYRRPADLVSDPTTGAILGRRSGSELVSYPTRRQIESSDLLAGQELVWLNDRLDAYLVHVQGSARLETPGGVRMHVGYAGTNGHAYTSLGQALAEDGKLDAQRLSLPAIRDYFQAHPDELDTYIARNARFVFFQICSGDSWPSGSLGLKVEPLRSLATDKAVFPAGVVTLVATQLPGPGGGGQRFVQFMVDQDTGGAISAPGRADIYTGIGVDAGRLAGRLRAQGRLYYLLLKPQRRAYWRGRLRAAGGAL